MPRGRVPFVDNGTQTHQYAFVRTTIELPDELYYTLKARAAISGVTMRVLVQRLIEDGLRSPRVDPGDPSDERALPPPLIPPTGEPLPDLTPEALHRLEEEDDLERHARSLGR